MNNIREAREQWMKGLITGFFLFSVVVFGLTIDLVVYEATGYSIYQYFSTMELIIIIIGFFVMGYITLNYKKRGWF